MRDITIKILLMLGQPHDGYIGKKLELIDKELPNMLPELYNKVKDLMGDINGACGEIQAMKSSDISMR